MIYRILGSLEVERDGEPIVISSHKLRSLLAILLINANQIVSTDRLIDELWGEADGGHQLNSLWVHVSKLRKILRVGTSDTEHLVTRAPGYLLRVEPDSVDAAHFERSLAEGQALLARDPAAASIVLSEALRMWRGHPLSDFAYEEWAQPDIRRLSEMRLAAIEARIDADLARGLSGPLVGELESLVVQHPLREHFVAQLMTALHRAGRRAESLRAFARFRARLSEELGLEPSDSLQRLEDEILSGEQPTAKSAHPAATSLSPGLAIRGYELRSQLAEWPSAVAYRAYQPALGREVTIKVVEPAVANDTDFIRRFDAEASSIASLEHAHIVPLYDYWREPDAAFFVTRSLPSAHIGDAGPYQDDKKLEVARQTASALAAAHRLGVVHKRLRPESIHIDSDGNAYVADFELATLSTDQPPDVSYDAPELIAGAAPSPQADVYSWARILTTTLTQMPPALSPILERALDADPEKRFSNGTDLAVAIELAIGGSASGVAPVLVENPYKGLRPFEQNDAHRFFGRERVVERLLVRLGHPGREGRFVAVVGPSGSGKSSVVKAGLLPALRSGALPGSERWFIAEMVPAPHPIDQLAHVMETLSAENRPFLLDSLLDDSTGLQTELTTVLPDDGSDLMLMIDQFEELFTQVDQADRDQFIDLLVGALDASTSRLRVVVTLRADFYDRPLAHSDLGARFRLATEPLPPMTSDELANAIEGPARGIGVRFEPGLVASLVADVADQPGSLPLLQYTLTELFERRSGSTIGVNEYRDVGGVTGALASRAESVYQALSPPDRHTVRQLMLRLVTPGQGVADTRRRARIGELSTIGGRALESILDELGRHRLVTFDRDPETREPTVEIAHEALIRSWGRLAGWLEDAREDLLLTERVRSETRQWLNLDRDPQYLMSGGWLSVAETRRARVELTLTADEDHFLDEAIARRDEAAATKKRRRFAISAGFGIAALLASVLAAFALINSAAADRSAEEARGRALALAASSSEVLGVDPELSLLLAIESARVAEPSRESMTALHQAIADQRTIYTYDSWPEEQGGSAVRGDLSADGSLILANAFLGDYLEVVDRSTDSILWSREFLGTWVSAYFVSGGSAVLVGVGYDFSSRSGEIDDESLGLYLFDARTGEELFHNHQICGVYLPNTDVGVTETVALVHRPEFTCQAPAPTTVSVFDIDSRSMTDFPATTPQPNRSAISTDGRVAAYPMNDGSVGLFETATGEPLDPSDIQGDWEQLALNHDGSRLILGSVPPDSIRVIDTATMEEVAAFSGHESEPRTAWFSDDGTLAFSAAGDGTVRIWDPETAVELAVIRNGVFPEINAMSADKSLLLSSDAGSTARLVDPRAGAIPELSKGAGAPNPLVSVPPDFSVTPSDQGSYQVVGRDVAFDVLRAGDVVFTVDCLAFHTAWVPQSTNSVLGCDDSIRLVDASSGTQIASRGWSLGVPPSLWLTAAPDGRFVAGTAPHEVYEPFIEVLRSDDLSTIVRIDRPHSGTITDLAISIDGESLASSSLDGWVRVWSPRDGTLLHGIKAPGPAFGVEFIADDRHLLVTLEDGTAYEYTLDPEELVEIARSRVTRGFTQDECRRYLLDPCPTLEQLTRTDPKEPS